MTTRSAGSPGVSPPCPTGDPEGFLRALFDAAVAAAMPSGAVSAHLPPAPEGRLVALGAGKAAAAMAAALEDALEAAGRPAPEGLVLTRHGHGEPTRSITVREGGHPTPDAAGAAATAEILAAADALGAGDLMVALISGGGSSLLAEPVPGVSLEDLRATAADLLRSGAPIDAMNTVRRHLQAAAGGRLAARAYPATTLALAISDVPGDDPAVIASGPTVPDPTTLADARAVLERFGVTPPASVAVALSDAANETPGPGDPRLSRAETRVIAAPQASLEAAAALARAAGVTPLILGDALEGEAREVGAALAGIALQARRHAQPTPPPCVLLSGGETTVTVRGDGVGGRNVECLMGALAALARAPDGPGRIHALMADTDGVDGAAAVAGAVIGPDTLARIQAAGLSLDAAMAAQDGHGFFGALGAQVITGPTRTNVNDFRAFLVL